MTDVRRLDADADDAAVIAATRTWIERAVIGLNLCPFARVPFLEGRVLVRVSRATDADGLLDDLVDALQVLQATPAETCETALLVHPQVMGDFLEFNDFLDVADAAVEALDLEGEVQVASFHPDYQFADSAPDDAANHTNRSPYPTLHLLREASIERAVDAVADTDAIYERNIETLRRLGKDGWEALWRT